MSVAFRVVRTRTSRWLHRLIGLVCVMPLLAVHAQESDDPLSEPPVLLLVPAAVGSIEDQLARVLSHHLSLQLHRAVSVVPQASVLGTAAQDASAPPDGRHYILGWTSQMALPPLAGRRGARPMLDTLEVVAPVAHMPYVLVVNAALPVRSVGDFTEHVRRRPGELHFASSGNGSLMHLVGQLYMSRTETNMVHVPYSAASHATNNLMTGDIQAMFHLLPAIAAPLRQERLRALGVMARQRAPLLPDVPTMEEQGYGGLEASNWFVLLAPRGTSSADSVRVRAAVNALADDAMFRDGLARLGAWPVLGGAHDAYRLIHDESARWLRAAEDASPLSLQE